MYTFWYKKAVYVHGLINSITQSHKQIHTRIVKLNVQRTAVLPSFYLQSAVTH